MKKTYITPKTNLLKVETEGLMAPLYSVKIFDNADGLHRLDERYPVKEEDLPEGQEVGAKEFGKNSFDIWNEEEY